MCEKGKGLVQHDLSATHLQAMATWQELEVCKGGGLTIDLLVDHDVANSYKYLFTIVDVIRFLVVNEMSWRGDKETKEKVKKKIRMTAFLLGSFKVGLISWL